MGICDSKNARVLTTFFFHFHTANVKFYHDTELCIPKYSMFLDFQVFAFLSGK